MKSILKKVLKVTVAVAMCFSSLPWLNKQVNYEVQAAQETNYEIYPKPHKMTYSSGEMIVSAEVNVVYDSKIDQATRNHLQKVLESKGKKVSVTNEKVTGKTNVLVGINNSKEYVDQYVNSTYNITTPQLFTHFGAYYFATSKDEIVVLGTDSDAAFYGITSLKQIFNQIDGATLRHFEMEDYADVKIRGFIEGYYGLPWSSEDRKELMRFGGDIKMTSYVFAPKDDPYHKQLWREPYPAAELAKLKAEVAVGNETKCRFVWTAHPFMGGFDRNNADEEIATLIRKFEHLYNDAGVRQFGVLGDDVGGLPRSIVVKMMQEVGKWAKSKGDVYDVVFCPGGYNHSWQGDYSELNEYDAGFPDNVQIFWTGEAVCKPIEQATLNHFRTHNKSNGKRRAPLFWLNWPVNDINHSRMIMGHSGNMLQKNINLEDLAGAVTNPMQESEPSKVAIFQLANYAWNVADYDSKQTWKDCFKYIEPDAANEMYVLAKHMANPQPNGHGLVMPESEDIAPLLTEFKTKLNNGTVTETDITNLLPHYEEIINACDGLLVKSKNAALKEDLRPFIASIKDLAQASIDFLNAKKALLTNKNSVAVELFANGQATLKSSATYTKPMLNGSPEIVDPGSTQLIPFAKELEKHLSTTVSSMVGLSGKNNFKITVSSNYTGIHEGNLNNVIDGRDNTHVWFNQYEAVGKYVQLDFSQPKTIYGVDILAGTSNNSDTFKSGQVKYQLEGQTEWKTLGEVQTNYAKDIKVSAPNPIENVKAVRYECTEAGSSGAKWVAFREFKVHLEPQETNFTKEVIHIADHWAASASEKQKLVDGNKNSNCHFAVRNNGSYGNDKDHYLINDYYGVKLSKKITLGKIEVLQGQNDSDGDYFRNAQLEYSENGTDWHKLGEPFVNKHTITFDASDLNVQAQYVRLKALDKQHVWVRAREFDVKAKSLFNAKAYTNVDTLKTLGANILKDTAYLQPKDSITLKPNEFIGIKYDRIHDISNIESVVSNDQLSVEVSKNEHEFSTYTSGAAKARYVRLVNKTNQDITFNLTTFKVHTNEFEPIHLEAAQGFSVYTGEGSKFDNLFDGDWTNQLIMQGSQNKGSYFIVDLGREIDLNKFKVVCRDSEHDFTRHGKISSSLNKEQWTTVMELGNQDQDNPNEAQNSDEIGFVLPDHETSYNTKTVNLTTPQKARYLKFEITRNKAGSDKWVRFQEFIINGEDGLNGQGQYLPSVNDPTFEGSKDTRNGKYEYLLDGSLLTAFIPEENKGSITYHKSENLDTNVVRILQASQPISNAVVTARIVKPSKAAGTIETVTLGKLSQVNNEFVLPVGTKVLDVTITWENVIPVIKELVFSKQAQVQAVNKAALEAELAKVTNLDTSTWTTASKKAFDQAKANALEVKDNTYVSQASVDAATTALQTAVANKEEKGDVSTFDAMINAKFDQTLYTVRSWRAYSAAVEQLKMAVTDAENVSKADVARLTKAYNDAKDGLTYNPLKKEEATYLSGQEQLFVDSVKEPNKVYTSDSWNAYVTALRTLNEKINDKSLAPAQYVEASEAVKAAKNALVSSQTLHELVDEFANVDKTMYTTASYNAYKEAVDAAKALLVHGSVEDIRVACETIRAAKANLILVATMENVEKLMNELSSLDVNTYTHASRDAAEKVVEEVKKAGLDTVAKVEQAAKDLQAAKAQLVNVISLRQALGRAYVDQTLYTIDSYANLKKVVMQALPLLENGTPEEIDAMVLSLDEAVRALEKRVTEKDVQAYLDTITFDKNKDAYTKETYAAYKEAYDALVAMKKDTSNVSIKQFADAKAKFEASAKALVKNPNNQGSTINPVEPQKPSESKPNKDETGTGDTTTMMTSVVAMAIAAFAVVVLRKRKMN